MRTLTPIIDSHEQLRRHILWLMLIRVILFTLLLGFSLLLQSKGLSIILPPPNLVVVFLSLIYIYSIGSAALLATNTSSNKRIGISQLLSDTLFITLLVYTTGCSQSIFTAFFILPVIAGGLLLYRMGGLICATGATFSLALIHTAEYFHYLPAYFNDLPYQPESLLASLNRFSTYGLIFFVAAILSGLLASRLRSTEAALSQTSLAMDRLTQLHEKIVNDITTGILTVNENKIVVSCNPAASKITGYSAEQIVGHLYQQLFPCLIEQSQGRQSTALRRQDHQQVRVEYTFSHLNMGEKNTVTPLPTFTPQKHWLIITLQDVSQIEAMENKVREAERLAEIGELSAAIAHDFRNPLAAISGSAQMLAEELIAPSQHPKSHQNQKQLTDIVLRETKRMDQVIAAFLTFARPEPLCPRWFNLNRLVTESLEARQLENKNSGLPPVTAKIEIPAALDTWGDRVQIRTLLDQLLENSYYAMQMAGNNQPIAIRGTEISDLSGQAMILLEMKDQGTGLTPTVREKMFRPFFTTREIATGLGLSIAQKIVIAHQGMLTIDNNKDGIGCFALVYLPLPQAKAIRTPVSPT